jgi:3-mercaptopyruvate sulfurtransferase SseA
MTKQLIHPMHKLEAFLFFFIYQNITLLVGSYKYYKRKHYEITNKPMKSSYENFNYKENIVITLY